MINVTINATVHLHDDREDVGAALALVTAKLNQLASAVGTILETVQREEIIMTKEYDELADLVEQQSTVNASIEALETNLKAQIEALKDDPAKLKALADKLRASQDELKAFVVANTPAEATTDPAAETQASDAVANAVQTADDAAQGGTNLAGGTSETGDNTAADAGSQDGATTDPNAGNA